MVSFYKTPKKPRQAGARKRTGVMVDSLDIHGVGVSRSQKPVMFIEGALPGECVDVSIQQTQKQVVKASTIKVVQASEKRQQPFCPVYSQCGGCQLQHIDADDALTERQHAMQTYWVHHLGVANLPWQAPLTGERPAYRRKARLAVDARNPASIKLGFRQQSSKAIVDVKSCPVLVPALQALMPLLRDIVFSYPASRHIGHIQVLAGDDVCEVTIKATRDLPAAMRDELAAFGQQTNTNVLLENATGAYETLHHFAQLRCQTIDDLYVTPSPEDFVQVNAVVNKKMVTQAIDWLAPEKDDVIADWFAGLGNFSFGLARKVQRLYAVEGVASMVQKGQAAAQAQGIDNIVWQHLDLNEPASVQDAINHGFTKMLLDPSREGAAQVCQHIAGSGIKQVVYVSCNPSTFTRDAQILLKAGYNIEKIGLVEMFPYTRHLEVMALFSLRSE